jgi:TatD DNase family protein
MIDSHCHLADTKFSSDIEDVIRKAKEAGVKKMITIADDLEEGECCIEIAEQFDGVYATVGVHPHHASKWQATSENRLVRLLQSSSKVVGLGEIGLDYHYMKSPKNVQREVFRVQLEIGKELNLPIVIHCRDAIDDVWEIVDFVNPKKLVLHCCCEKFDDIKRFLDRGWLISFTGMITYQNANVLRETVKQCPIEQLMIETDAPYLTPKRYRGKRNEPAYVVEVAKAISEIKMIEQEDVDRITSTNAITFFQLPS